MTVDSHKSPTEGLGRYAVLGGGLAGLCTARSLARGGASVTLIERRTLGSGATGASAGLLEAPWAPRSAFQRGMTASYQGYARFVRELQLESGVSIEFERLGSLHLAAGDGSDDDAKAARLSARVESQRGEGAPVEWWDRDALRRRVPGISERFAGGLFNHEAGRVHAPDLVTALSRSLQRLGVRVVEGIERMRCEGEGDGRRWSLYLRTAAGEDLGVEGVRLVACAGAWTRELLEALGGRSEAEVVPVRGQMLEISLAAPPATVIHHDDRYVIPRPDRRVWVGATVEEVGFDEEVTSDGIESLLGTAREIFPAIRGGDVMRSWCGLRPKALRRGGAILGTEGVAVLAGHYRSGILAVPRDADRLAARLLGPEALPESPFDLDSES